MEDVPLSLPRSPMLIRRPRTSDAPTSPTSRSTGPPRMAPGRRAWALAAFAPPVRSCPGRPRMRPQAQLLRGHHRVQQLLRVRHRQGRPGENAGTLRTAALDGRGRGRGQAGPAPTTWTILLKGLPLVERIYRLRCVEAWSMVIPWNGYPAGGPDQATRADQPRRSTSSSPRSSIRSRCPGSGAPSWIGPTSRGSAWTRRCIRSRCWPPASTASRSRTRTAPRCA